MSEYEVGVSRASPYLVWHCNLLYSPCTTGTLSPHEKGLDLHNSTLFGKRSEEAEQAGAHTWGKRPGRVDDNNTWGKIDWLVHFCYCVLYVL